MLNKVSFDCLTMVSLQLCDDICHQFINIYNQVPSVNPFNSPLTFSQPLQSKVSIEIGIELPCNHLPIVLPVFSQIFRQH